MHIPADSMKIYRETARRRQAEGTRRLRQQRERAWEVARQAAALLRQQFGAERVLVFGSLVRSDLFHSRSDVDLAVWGLAEGQYYHAVARVLALDPAVEIDLVCVEEAPASLLACIEREGVGDMNAEYATLAARIRQSLLDLERVVSRAKLLMDKAQRSGDVDYLDGVALNLHGFYAGVERILEDIARTVEQTIPAGPDWHQDLLLQMSVEIATIRPPRSFARRRAATWTNTGAFGTLCATSTPVACDRLTCKKWLPGCRAVTAPSKATCTAWQCFWSNCWPMSRGDRPVAPYFSTCLSRSFLVVTLRKDQVRCPTAVLSSLASWPCWSSP